MTRKNLQALEQGVGLPVDTSPRTWKPTGDTFWAALRGLGTPNAGGWGGGPSGGRGHGRPGGEWRRAGPGVGGAVKAEAGKALQTAGLVGPAHRASPSPRLAPHQAPSRWSGDSCRGRRLGAGALGEAGLANQGLAVQCPRARIHSTAALRVGAAHTPCCHSPGPPGPTGTPWAHRAPRNRRPRRGRGQGRARGSMPAPTFPVTLFP